MLLKARLSITRNHTEAAASEARQLGAGKAGDCISFASANAHSATLVSTDTHCCAHFLLATDKKENSGIQEG